MHRGYRDIMIGLYGLSLLVCFICNLAIQHTLNWFFIVLASEAVAFPLTAVPVLVKKNCGLWTLGAFDFSLNFCCLFAGSMREEIGLPSLSLLLHSALRWSFYLW